MDYFTFIFTLVVFVSKLVKPEKSTVAVRFQRLNTRLLTVRHFTALINKLSTERSALNSKHCFVSTTLTILKFALHDRCLTCFNTREFRFFEH